MVVTADGTVGGLGVAELLDRSVAREARGFLDEGRSAIRRYSRKGEVMGSDIGVSIHAFARPPSMVVFGAIDFSAALAKLAGEIGYQVTIVDAREAFLQSPRFSEHAEVVVDWPDRYLASRELGASDAVLVFTHDPKFDEPALIAALESDAGYIGALGSRRTQADREERLRARGVAEEELARISSPCGLDVGARTPAETAIAVLGEILALRAGRRGGRLADASGPIPTRRPSGDVPARPPVSSSPRGKRGRWPAATRRRTPRSQASSAAEPRRTRRRPARRASGEATAGEGIVPAELGGSDAPREMLAEDPELDSAVLGRTTGSDEPATEEGVDLSAGDDADATSDGGRRRCPRTPSPT